MKIWAWIKNNPKKMIFYGLLTAVTIAAIAAFPPLLALLPGLPYVGPLVLAALSAVGSGAAPFVFGAIAAAGMAVISGLTLGIIHWFQPSGESNHFTPRPVEPAVETRGSQNSKSDWDMTPNIDPRTKRANPAPPGGGGLEIEVRGNEVFHRKAKKPSSANRAHFFNQQSLDTSQMSSERQARTTYSETSTRFEVPQ